MLRSNPFSQVVNPEKHFEVQNAQYRDIILLTGTVAALSGGTDFSVNVSSLGHFLCQFITGTFETIAIPAAAIVDTGVTYLSGQLKDGARNLMSDRVPLDLLLSPGRRKSATSTTVVADPVGNSLFYPLEFEYLYLVNNNITMNVANTSNQACNFEIAFHGLRIVANSAADEVRKKAAARHISRHPMKM
jgi:hypothetical protein